MYSMSTYLLVFSVLYNEALCSSLLSIVTIDTMTKSNLGGDGLFHLKEHCPSLREAKAGTGGRDHGGMMHARWLAFPGLLNHLSYTAQAPLPKSTGGRMLLCQLVITPLSFPLPR